MTKVLCLKKAFTKIAIFSIKMSESKIFLRLTQATNTYKHIFRNIGATIKASRKLDHDKVFFNVFTKRPLKKKKKKKVLQCPTGEWDSQLKWDNPNNF